jgi:hypothetical protein
VEIGGDCGERSVRDGGIERGERNGEQDCRHAATLERGHGTVGEESGLV